jgi:hypothetical protein
MIKYVYIDESGDLGKYGSKYFAIIALITENPISIGRIIKKARIRILDKKLKEVSEIISVSKEGVALINTPKATTNIYEQQYQMGLFIKEFYENKSIVANDIGAINFFFCCSFSFLFFHFTNFVGCLLNLFLHVMLQKW